MYTVSSYKAYDEARPYSLLGLIPALIAIQLAEDLLIAHTPLSGRWETFAVIMTTYLLVYAVWVWPVRRAFRRRRTGFTDAPTDKWGWL